MKLQDLYQKPLTEGDGSELPPQVQEAIKREITTLAKDTEQQWNNALEVVHQAYQNCDAERPTPAMRDAWREYEDFITLAVQQLAKYQPDGNWKLMSADSPSSPPVTAY